MAKTNKTPKAEDNAELRTISLLKILNTYSDENHELSTKNIIYKAPKGMRRYGASHDRRQEHQAACGLRL